MVLCAVLFCSARNSTAGTADPSSPLLTMGYRWDSWSTLEGLRSSAVQSIIQSRDGYLWIGTQDGLARFDGAHFTVFDKKIIPGAGQLSIGALLEAQDGTLWIGTEAPGLVSLKDGEFHLYTTSSGLGANAITSILQDRQGNIWVGTTSGLSLLKGGKFTTYTARQGLSADWVVSLYQDRQGILWIGTVHGLTRMDNGQFRVVGANQGLGKVEIDSIAEDSEGLWLGTDQGLLRLRAGNVESYAGRMGLPRVPVHSVILDRDRRLWVGTGGVGLFRLEGGEFKKYTSAGSFATITVQWIFQDRDANLWVGTWGDGMIRLSEEKFKTLSQRSLDTNSVYQSRDGSIWWGTNGEGLARFKEGITTLYTTRDGLSSNLILSLWEDRAGDLWIGTDGGGLDRLHDGRFTVYSTQQGLAGNAVHCIYDDEEGGLWIGTSAHGLQRLKDGKFTTYTVKDGLASDAIRFIHEDRKGNLWIATKSGLSRSKPGTRSAFQVVEGLAKDAVMYLYEDSDRVLWIGTWSSGLKRLQGGVVTTYTSRDGLFDDSIWTIVEDHNGNFWMTSDHGISRVSKRELEDFAAGKIHVLKSVTYGMADGLKTDEFNGGMQPSGWKTAEGLLVFPGGKGPVVVEPERIKPNLTPPSVMIESVTLNQTPFNPYRSVLVPPGKGELEFEYTAIDFLAPQGLRFRYKLEGFDRDWVDAGARRAAYYTNIPPGKYRFRVMAGNRDGAWGVAGGAFDFTLRPHFYETYSFYVLCGSFFSFAAIGLHRYRVRKLNAREKELTLRVQERTRTLQAEVAERRRAEEAVRQMSSQLELILNSAGEGIYGLDLQGKTTFINPAAARMAGWAREEMVGQPQHNLLHHTKVDGTPYPRHECPIYAAFQDGSIHQVEDEVFWRKDGTSFPVEYTSTPIWDKQQLTGAVVTFKDITERKRAEEALRASESRCRALFDHVADPVFIVDAMNYHYLDCNETAVQAYGYSREELLAMTPFDLRPPEAQVALDEFADLSALKLHVLENRVHSNGGAQGRGLTPFATTHQTKDGRRMEVEVLADSIEYQGRDAYIVLARDVTARKKVEELRAGENYVLEMIATSAPIEDMLAKLIGLIESQCPGMLCSVLLLDADGEHLRHGAAPSLPVDYIRAIDGIRIGPRVGSCGTAAYLGRPVIVSDIQEDPLWADFRDLPAQYELRACWSTPILSHEGRVLGTFAMYYRETRSPSSAEMQLIDVATRIARIGISRKQAEEALSKAETRYRTLVEQLPAVTYLAEYGASGRWFYVSPQIESLLGFSPSEWIADPELWFRQLHVDDRNWVLAEEEQTRARNEPFRAEYRVLASDGRLVWVRDEATLLRDTQGGPGVLQGVIYDVTERKRAEEVLRQRTVELERSNADLEQFAYVASHDLREPLRMVSSFTQLLAQRYKGQLDAQADEFINFAVEGANRMLALIDGLLSFSRVQRQARELQPTDCQAALRRALTNLGVALREAQAKVTYDELPTVMADQSQMEQLFQNLIGNAVKFHGKANPRVHVAAARNGKDWIFSVRDNGIGIDPAHKDRIFALFQRLHSRTAYPGTGIGLSICKKIVERHGGRIWVESAEGSGATFYFTVPLAESVAA